MVVFICDFLHRRRYLSKSWMKKKKLKTSVIAAVVVVVVVTVVVTVAVVVVVATAPWFRQIGNFSKPEPNKEASDLRPDLIISRTEAFNLCHRRCIASLL